MFEDEGYIKLTKKDVEEELVDFIYELEKLDRNALLVTHISARGLDDGYINLYDDGFVSLSSVEVAQKSDEYTIKKRVVERALKELLYQVQELDRDTIILARKHWKGLPPKNIYLGKKGYIPLEFVETVGEEGDASEALAMLEEFKKTPLAREMKFKVKEVLPKKDGKAKITFDYVYFHPDEDGDLLGEKIEDAMGIIEPAEDLDKFLSVLFEEVVENDPEYFPGFIYIEDMFGDKKDSIIDDEDNLLYWAIRQNLDVDDVDYEEDYYAVILPTTLEAWSKKNRTKIISYVKKFIAKNF